MVHVHMISSLKQVVHPPQNIKVKSEGNVRTYQAHTGTYVRVSRLTPTTPHATKETKHRTNPLMLLEYFL